MLGLKMRSQKNEPGISVSRQIELHVGSTKPVRFLLESSVTEGYIIGRSDPTNSNYVPDIDLMTCEAAQHGVSRRHAAIVRYRDQICLVDLNSANGTFINGEKLRADIPYALHPDDKLRFGTLFVYVALM
jgi:pSer/pThr/pTyr-binding forkhead associated (FHA) protein